MVVFFFFFFFWYALITSNVINLTVMLRMLCLASSCVSETKFHVVLQSFGYASLLESVLSINNFKSIFKTVLCNFDQVLIIYSVYFF